MAARLETDKGSGSLPPDFELDVVVAVATTYLQGMRRAVLLSYERRQFERQIDLLLTGLGF